MKRIIIILISILAFGAASFAQTNENPCPQIKVIGPQSLSNIDEAEQLKIEASKEIEKYKIEYLRTASRGKITKGQGMPKIELTPRFEDVSNNIFVTVKLDGLPENCLDTMSHTFAVSRRAVDTPWFDRFGRLPKNDLYGRLDSFFVALLNAPTAEGLITLELDKTETRAKKIKRLNIILKHVNRRRFDKSRLKFLISEAVEEHTKLYVVPQDAKITQVLSESEIRNIIKGEDLEQKIKEFFPRKEKSK
ncbi:MAG TPA: hypothetical protein VGB00_12885 [Pyrinomonadaceae bacterium]